MDNPVCEAVKICIDNWTAMNLALDHGWGQESDKTALITELADTIMNFQVEEEDLQEILDNYMEDKFNVVLEDDSSRELSKIFLKVFNEWRNGESKELERLKSLQKPRIQDCKKINELELVTHMMQDTCIDNPPELVDEDGFELVQSKRKRK